MYKIVKIINNNVLVVLDSKLREYVVFGKGIGFKRQTSDTLLDSDIERKYLATGTESKYAIKLIEETDYDVMVVCEEIKQMIEKSYNQEYTNHAYFSLIDHINNTLYRQKISLNLQSEISMEDLSLYKKEQDLAREIANLLTKRLNINISSSEVIYLTLHLVSYIYDSPIIQLNERVLKITNEIIEIIRYEFMNEIADNFNLHRFIVHLRFFILRNIQKQNASHSPTNENLYKQLLNENKNSELLLEKICMYLVEEYDFDITSDEKLYLLIHLSKLTSI